MLQYVKVLSNVQIKLSKEIIKLSLLISQWSHIGLTELLRKNICIIHINFKTYGIATLTSLEVVV